MSGDGGSKCFGGEGEIAFDLGSALVIAVIRLAPQELDFRRDGVEHPCKAIELHDLDAITAISVRCMTEDEVAALQAQCAKTGARYRELAAMPSEIELAISCPPPTVTARMTADAIAAARVAHDADVARRLQVLTDWAQKKLKLAA